LIINVIYLLLNMHLYPIKTFCNPHTLINGGGSFAR